MASRTPGRRGLCYSIGDCAMYGQTTAPDPYVLLLILVELVCVGVTIPVSSRSGVAQKQWIERVQKRVAITSTMVGDIKAMQMLGLSKALSKIVTKLRQIEVETSLRFRKLLIWQLVICMFLICLFRFILDRIY